MFRSFVLYILFCLTPILLAQSTCPVKTTLTNYNHQQRCKCGIKTDGQIYIYCARKQLTQLPEFTRSSILYEELILSGNQITRISTNSFRGLRVKRLYLDANPIQKIDQNALVELANYLEELVISVDNSQSMQTPETKPTLPARLFKSLLNLKIIRLTGLQVTRDTVLSASLFNRTRKLEVIHLVDCGVHRLDSNAFAGVEYSLRELNLDNNQLQSVEEIFSELDNMKRLQKLVLSRNKIRRIGRFSVVDSFDNSKPGVDSMGSNMVNNVAKIFELDLSFNAINHIDRHAFAGSVLGAVTKLHLNNNELSQFQLGFIAQLGSLKELYLDYNKISYVPDNMFINARYLETLSLKGNFISQIGSEFAFSGLHFSLTRLNLAGNKLHTIGKRVFMQTTKLAELNLERNELGSHFRNLLKTTNNSGDFNSTPNPSVINTFEGIESELKSLNLENNQLQASHLWSLVSLLNVESLRIGHNHLNQLDLPAVQSASKLSDVFKFYRNLTYLDIQNSSLTQMPYFTGLNRSLASLNLAHNSICNINANNLQDFYSHIDHLNLNSNPLQCSMELTSLRKWIDTTMQKSHHTKPAQFNFYSQAASVVYPSDPSLNWRCATPYQFTNKHLSQLSLSDLVTPHASNQCALDMDAFMYAQSLLVTKTTTNLPSTTIKVKSTTTTQHHEPIITVTPKQLNLLIEKLLTPSRRMETVINQENTEDVASFLSSVELKQTLLGSLIGAFLVLTIVCGILCVLKTTRSKLKDMSLCSSTASSSNLKDIKSQHISSTSSSSSPYEMSKLTLQTMCINSSNSTASSGSGSTNSSCMCGGQTHSECNFFNKMDPLRLTLLNQASGANPTQYLNNLHYLASNLPYSPNDSFSYTNSPTNQFNPTTDPTNTNKQTTGQNLSMLLLNDNTYDKLHQRFNTLNTMVQQQQQQQHMQQSHTLSHSQHNQLINKYIQNLNRQLQSSSNNTMMTNQTTTSESVPFLIIQNMNDMNRIVNNNNNSQESSELGSDTYQHTYHEIGECLMNNASNLGRMMARNGDAGIEGVSVVGSGQKQRQEASDQSEMFI